MTSTTGAIAAPLAAPRAKRPGWIRIALLMVLACVLASVAIVALALPLTFAGLLPTEDEGFAWPWPATDAWSLAADVGWLSLWYLLLTWAVRRCVRDWTDGWDVRVRPLLLIVVAASPLGWNGAWLLPFALLVIVVRQRALVPAPAPGWRPSRPALGLIGIGALASALAALTYQPLHPLSAAFEERRSNASFGISAGGDGDRRELSFMLGNDGIAEMTVRSIRAVGLGTGDVTIRTHREDVTHADSLADLRRPIGIERIPRGGTFAGDVHLTQAGCRGARTNGPAAIFALDVRYETLGVTRTERLEVSPPAHLQCR